MPALVPIIVGGGVAYLAYQALTSDKKEGSTSGPSKTADPNEKLSGGAPSTGSAKPGSTPAQAEPLSEAPGTNPVKNTTDPRTGLPAVGDAPRIDRLEPIDEAKITDIGPMDPTLSLNEGEMGGITSPPAQAPNEGADSAGESKSPVVQQTRLLSSIRAQFSGLRF